MRCIKMITEVFFVRKIDDEEYGCRNVEAVFSKYEDAEKYIENAGNLKFTFWDKHKEMLYIIEGCDVN